MIAESLAPVAVSAEVMGVVVALKQAVLLDDPGDLRPHVRPQDRGGDLGVSVGGKIVADVVDERRHHHLIIGPVLARAGRGLQRMREARHGVSAEAGLERTERGEDAVGERAQIVALVQLEELVILASPVLHLGEADDAVCVLCHLAVLIRVQLRVRRRSVAAFTSADL